MKNTYYLSLKASFSDWLVRDRLISLGNSFELPALFRKFGWRFILICFRTKEIKKITSRLRFLMNFAKYILIMTRRHGEEYSVKYLKSSQLAIQRAVAGEPLSSLRELEADLPLPRLSRSGLPTIIPLADRRAILAGRGSVIKWWLTIYSVYRVISIPGKLKTSTITDPLTVSESNIQDVSDEIYTKVLSLKEIFPKVRFEDKGMLWLETSSPTSNTSWVGYFNDLKYLIQEGINKEVEYLMIILDQKRLLEAWKAFNGALLIPELQSVTDKTRKTSKTYDAQAVGQLSLKYEAAGKVRVFALVDAWTQSVLSPLHHYLFSLLKKLPNDGTFDHYVSVKRCIEKVKLSGCSFGYDLSAATDRLPIDLQVSVLSALISKELAETWKSVLVNRNYMLGQLPLRYSVGQPMGALSSWAMLALTHHLLVQVSYQRVKGITSSTVWYDNYELVGDDIIIFDEDIAKSYLQVMEEIGVPINLSKSVISKRLVTEFVKVTTVNGENTSALSWKMFLSQNSLVGRVSIAQYFLQRDLGQKPISMLKKLLRKSKWKEGDLNFSYVSLLMSLAEKGRISFSSIVKSLYDLSFPTRSAYKAILSGVNVKKFEHYLTLLMKDPELTELPSNQHQNMIWQFDSQRAERVIAEVLQRKVDRFTSSSSRHADHLAFKVLMMQLDEDREFIVRNLWEGSPLASILELYSKWFLEDKFFGRMPIPNPYFNKDEGWREEDRFANGEFLPMIRKEIQKAIYAPFPIHPLETWFALEEKIDNLSSFCELAERARNKKVNKPLNLTTKSKLKPLLFLAKIKQFRPSFMR